MLQICLPRLGKRDSDLPTTRDNMIQNGRGTLSQWIYPNPQLTEDFLRFLGQLLHRKDFSFFFFPPLSLCQCEHLPFQFIAPHSPAIHLHEGLTPTSP